MVYPSTGTQVLGVNSIGFGDWGLGWSYQEQCGEVKTKQKTKNSWCLSPRDLGSNPGSKTKLSCREGTPIQVRNTIGEFVENTISHKVLHFLHLFHSRQMVRYARSTALPDKTRYFMLKWTALLCSVFHRIRALACSKGNLLSQQLIFPNSHLFHIPYPLGDIK